MLEENSKKQTNNSMTQTKLPENIKKLRISSGMTQKQLSEHLNVTYQSVSKWEQGHSAPEYTTLKNLAELFNYTVDEMLSDLSNTEEVTKCVSVESAVKIRYEIEAEEEVVDKKKILIKTFIYSFVYFFFSFSVATGSYYEYAILFFIFSLFTTLLLFNYVYKINLNNKMKKHYSKLQEWFYILPNFVNKLGCIGVFFLKIPSILLAGFIYFVHSFVLMIVSLFVWGDLDGK